jgi:hypothetical protein
MTAGRLLVPVFLIGAGVLVSGLRVEGGEAIAWDVRRAALDAVAASGTIAGEEDGRALHRTA